MATIDDVIEWATTVPSWQGDAVRRLLIAGEAPLTAVDYSEILALAKADLKLAPAPDTVKPVLPSPGSFSGAPATAAAVTLLSIGDVQNVNIIKPDQTQCFAETGLTVLYGNNGSGKSGYARILKLACQARDKDERILSNVFCSTPSGLATATIKIKHDGETKHIVWTQGGAPDALLTNITVFDSRCARVITDERNEIAYLPYGADVFEKIADLLQRIKTDLEGEIADPVAVQDSAVVSRTASATFLESLSEFTKDEDVHAATVWTPCDESDLTAKEDLLLTSASAKAAPEIERLGKIKTRIEENTTTAMTLLTSCAELTNEAIEKTLHELAAAQSASATALAERQTPERLQGVASTSQWEILYRAAKRYSEEVAYPGETFPKTDDALCVLCQQPLDQEAIARFTRFKNFMEDATKAVLEAKREALEAMRQQFEDLAPLSGAALDSICDEIKSIDPKAGQALLSCYTEIVNRKKAALDLLKEGEDPIRAARLPPWPPSPQALLEGVTRTLTQKVADITAAANPEEHQKLITAVAESKSRKALNRRAVDIWTFIREARRNSNLRRAIATLRTQEITRQGTAIIRKNLTPELLSILKTELDALGSIRVPVAVKPTGASGETAHEMLLEGATGRARLSQVLSEGEARVIAIAGFLAELQVAKHTNAIVFDDPVSSLDHAFTRKIAARLAREGLKRQVIVFTHNIAFLMELEDAREDLARAGSPVPLIVHTLHRDGTSAGITTAGAPWYGMTVKQRVHHLEELTNKVKPLYETDIPAYNKEAAHIYGLLREAWESCVEDELLYSVVCRYRNSVQTLKLHRVSIEDADVHEIDRQMSKTSTWMTGHDKSKAFGHDRPGPEELLVDIGALRSFLMRIKARREETAERRKDLI